MKMRSYIFSFLYLVFPLIAIPYWAYVNGNWLMLFGIGASYLGSLCFRNEFGSIYFVSFIVLVSYCVYVGQFSIRNFYVTLFLCMSWGFINALLAQKFRDMAKQEAEGEEFKVEE
jgi:hypothetical protein